MRGRWVNPMCAVPFHPLSCVGLSLECVFRDREGWHSKTRKQDPRVALGTSSSSRVWKAQHITLKTKPKNQTNKQTKIQPTNQPIRDKQNKTTTITNQELENSAWWCPSLVGFQLGPQLLYLRSTVSASLQGVGYQDSLL